MTQELTSGDICEIADVPSNTLARWCSNGLIEPATNNGQGHGKHRTFTPMDALAICYANRWRQAGCSPPWIASVLNYFTDLSETELEKHLAAGRTFLLPMPDPLETRLAKMPPTLPETSRAERMVIRNLDLQICYDEVLTKIAKLTRRPKNSTGRNRGLATSK